MSDRFLRAAEVTALTGIPRSTRYQLIAEGKFPRPAKIGRIAVWPEKEIANWQKSVAARDRQSAA
jgi:prophage regulatory protein